MEHNYDDSANHASFTTMNSDDLNLAAVPLSPDQRESDVPPTAPQRRITKHMSQQTQKTGSEAARGSGLADLNQASFTSYSEDIALVAPQDRVRDTLPTMEERRETVVVQNTSRNNSEKNSNMNNNIIIDNSTITTNFNDGNNNNIIKNNNNNSATNQINVDPSNEDSFTMNSDDFNLIIAPLSPRKSRDLAPITPQRRSTVTDIPMRIRPCILLFGDSLTEYGFSAPPSSSSEDDDPDNPTTTTAAGWVSLLSNAYTRRADVLNRGFSGYTSTMACSLIQRSFGICQEGALFSVIWFGANDAAVEGDPQNVRLDKYKSNLHSIIRQFRSATKEYTAPILLLTPPPVDEEAWQKHCRETYGTEGPSSRTNHRAGLYGEAVKEAAGLDSRCAVVDVWELLEGETEHRGRYLSDGLHLNAAGNLKVFQGIMAAIHNHFPKLAPMTDGDGKKGGSGIPVEERLWKDLVKSRRS